MCIACPSRRLASASALFWHGPDASRTNCNPTDKDINILFLTLQQQGRLPNSLLCIHRQAGRVESNKIFRGRTFTASSTLITNITQPSLNNPKLPHKFPRQDNNVDIGNHFQIPNIHRYKHIPLLRPLNLDPLIMTSNKNTSMISTRVP
jgi:hypothetical protein